MPKPDVEVSNSDSSSHQVVRYQHLINNSPNSNYFVYYTDNIVDNTKQHFIDSYSSHNNDPVPELAAYSPSSIPIQLVTLVQSSIENAEIQQKQQFETQYQEIEEHLKLEDDKKNGNGTVIQNFVTSFSNLVNETSAADIDNVQESMVEDNKNVIASNVPLEDSLTNESRHIINNVTLDSFDSPIIVRDNDAAESEDIRSQHIGKGLYNRSSLKQLNVEILGDSDDHNNGQFLKEKTIYTSKVPTDPCDNDGNGHGVLITKQVYTTIKPVTITHLRESTAARLNTRYEKTQRIEIAPSTTPRNIATGMPSHKNSASPGYLAPIQAGLRLSNDNKSHSLDDCFDAVASLDEHTLVKVQKNKNIKNILINQESTKLPQFGARTKTVQQPVHVEKPIERIVKQPLFIEKPVERIMKQPIHVGQGIKQTVQQPVYFEKQVNRIIPQPVLVEKVVPIAVERIVEKPIHHTHHVDRPVPVAHHLAVHVPVAKVIEKPVPVEKIVTHEVKVPYPVTHVVDRPGAVEKIVEKPVLVEVPRYVDRPYPVEKVVERPYPVEVPIEKIIEKVVDRPVEVERVVEKQVQVPVPVTVEKVVEKIVNHPVPYTVEKIIDRPYPVEKIVEKIVDRPFPVQVPVEVPFHVPVHYPVEVPIAIPIPFTVEKYITLTVPEPKPTHSIIKTVHHEHIDLGKLLLQKKKHFVDHFFPKSQRHQKVAVLETPAKHVFQTSRRFHQGDLHFGASVSSPLLVDDNHLNIHSHFLTENPSPVFAVLPPSNGYTGNFGYLHNEPIVKDDYVGPTPLLEDHWAVKTDVKIRRSPGYGKSLHIEYGGFKPPLVPSVEIDEHGIPVHKNDRI
ncbi:uncharacterized protein LOC128724863 [Anopheles nili]|uniref:uncharacterized protein LOC128724863 n=1 Tax=Anopheles nili TaxID=185578 RepID=UPI00237B347E|nr:uncharacterized protein LOC128724863 [Anopheles nili]